MGLGHTSSQRTKARLAAVALLGIAYLLSAGASFLGIPHPFAINQEGASVTSVAVGSYVWLLGVRPGLAVEPWPRGSPDPGFTFFFKDGLTVDVAARSEFPTSETAFLAFALLAAAVLTRVIGLPGSSVALGLSAAVALGPLAPGIGYPGFLALAAIPPAVSILDIRAHSPEVGRSEWLWLLVVLLLLSLTIQIMAYLVPDGRWPWTEIWKTPGWAVVLIGIASAGPLLRRVIATPGEPSQRAADLVFQAIPLASSAQLAGSAQERRRLATEIHNDILPRLGQAILEIDASDPAGRERLSEVAAQIRRSMSERQETTLQQAGLVAAINGFVHQLDIPIDLKERSPAHHRAPRNVEHAAYRVAQLAIANAVQHSGADEIQVEVSESERELALRVADDGVGIDEIAEQAALARGRVGLADMRAQAQSVSAELAIRSMAGQGTTIEFRWTR